MKKIITKSYEEMSEMMVSILLAEMLKDKRSNISITAGSSPKRVYEILIEKYKQHKEQFQDIYFYNFDEIEVKEEPIGHNIAALYEQFYTPAKVEEKNIVKLNYENHQEFDKIIARDGGLDLMMIGLGSDGHFCGNMPYETDFMKETYKVFVKKEYPWYSFFEEMYPNGNIPEYMVTMGLQSLLKVKHLVLIVNGKGKAEILKKMLSSRMTNELPATGLLLHPNLTILMDEEAASLL